MQVWLGDLSTSEGWKLHPQILLSACIFETRGLWLSYTWAEGWLPRLPHLFPITFPHLPMLLTLPTRYSLSHKYPSPLASGSQIWGLFFCLLFGCLVNKPCLRCKPPMSQRFGLLCFWQREPGSVTYVAVDTFQNSLLNLRVTVNKRNAEQWSNVLMPEDVKCGHYSGLARKQL